MANDIWLKAFAMKAGKIIRDARNERGWSQSELARRVGVSQPAIMKIEKGVTTKSKHFPKIAQVLNLELSDLDSSLSPTSNPTDARLTSTMKKPQVERLKQEQLIGGDNLPVFSLAQGGPGALVLSNQPFRTIGRPHNLQTIEDAFGVLVAGDSMHPEYREGDIAYVDPHIPPRVGDACLSNPTRMEQ
jgi:transcriptional regulator with XRE-family HTH domain